MAMMITNRATSDARKQSMAVKRRTTNRLLTRCTRESLFHNKSPHVVGGGWSLSTRWHLNVKDFLALLAYASGWYCTLTRPSIDPRKNPFASWKTSRHRVE